LPSAIVEFDRLLATILANALDGALHESTNSSVKMLVLTGGPAIPPQEVQAELDQRLVLANQRLIPRWVRGPKGQTAASGQIIQMHLLELKPVLQAETMGHKVIAKLHRRLGWGWHHMGLPALRYSTSFADHGAEYWRTKLKSFRSIETLKPIAKIMLQRELYGPDPAVAGLAMKGLVQLEGSKALPTLLALARKGPAVRRGHAILALALLRSRDVTGIVKEAATASSPTLRAAAMEALGKRGLPEEAPLLRRGLEDRHPPVATAALIGLLKTGDRAGLKTAKQWLSDSQVRRREVLLARLAPLRLDLRALSNDLLRLSPRAPSASLVVVLAKVLGDRAVRPLLHLYKNVPTLRLAIINSASTSQAFSPLLRLAAEEKENPALRHRALAKLAYIKPPPRNLFQQIVDQDKDAIARLAAHVGLARLGQARSFLSLGIGARGRCIERKMVIPTLAKSMDQRTRSKLLKDALLSQCDTLYPLIWDQILRYQPNDPDLLAAAMTHTRRALRLKGALVVLGLRTGAVMEHFR
jgi:HEAT repeat protein